MLGARRLITMMTKALLTPGMALSSAMITLLSDLMRLKRRKTRKARSILRLPRGEPGGMAPDMSSSPTATTVKSKTFQPEFQNLR